MALMLTHHLAELRRRTLSMLGWMLVFGIMSGTAAVGAADYGIGFTAATMSGLVFGSLLVISALTRVLRGRV